MSEYELKYHRFGDRAILIVWPQEINRDILMDMLSFKAILQEAFENLILHHTYHSLCIQLDQIQNRTVMMQAFKKLYENHHENVKTKLPKVGNPCML